MRGIFELAVRVTSSFRTHPGAQFARRLRNSPDEMARPARQPTREDSRGLSHESWQGQLALVAGASSVVGRATALAFAQTGTRDMVASIAGGCVAQ
jgi:hypothetical protein